MDESHPQPTGAEAAAALVIYRLFSLVVIMVAVIGLVISMIPECGLAGVLICITALMLVLVVRPGERWG